MTGEANELLETMRELFYGLNEQIKSLNTEMKSEFNDVKERISKLEATQENVTSKNIQLLVEKFGAVTNKILKSGTTGLIPAVPLYLNLSAAHRLFLLTKNLLS